MKGWIGRSGSGLVGVGGGRRYRSDIETGVGGDSLSENVWFSVGNIFVIVVDFWQEAGAAEFVYNKYTGGAAR